MVKAKREGLNWMWIGRPVMFPDVIGGHCLIPNTELLLKSYDSEFLRLILESNEKRREEVKDEGVRRELKRLREGWKR